MPALARVGRDVRSLTSEKWLAAKSEAQQAAGAEGGEGGGGAASADEQLDLDMRLARPERAPRGVPPAQ